MAMAPCRTRGHTDKEQRKPTREAHTKHKCTKCEVKGNAGKGTRVRYTLSASSCAVWPRQAQGWRSGVAPAPPQIHNKPKHNNITRGSRKRERRPSRPTVQVSSAGTRGREKAGLRAAAPRLERARWARKP
eukprot:scaffold494_cov117-Isochrysis_galbana.AAC.20